MLTSLGQSTQYIRPRCYRWNTSTEGSLRRKKGEEKENKVEEFQLASLASPRKPRTQAETARETYLFKLYSDYDDFLQRHRIWYQDFFHKIRKLILCLTHFTNFMALIRVHNTKHVCETFANLTDVLFYGFVMAGVINVV